MGGIMQAEGSESGGKGWGSAPTPAPVRRYRCKLDTVGNVSRELARIYREARSGLLDVGDASKLAHVLSTVARIMADSELEARVALLEAKGLH